jgi:hypothetical protein
MYLEIEVLVKARAPSDALVDNITSFMSKPHTLARCPRKPCSNANELAAFETEVRANLVDRLFLVAGKLRQAARALDEM